MTRLDCVPLGIVVNTQAERFYDEGEDFWPKRYAIWGRLVAQQPDQIAYCIIDSKVDRPLHAVGVPADRRADASPSSRGARLAAGRTRSHGRRVQSRRAARAPSTTQILDDCRTEGSPGQVALGAGHRHAAVLRLSAAAGHHVHLSGVKVNERAAVLMALASRAQTFSRPAKSWPATFSAKATWRASA